MFGFKKSTPGRFELSSDELTLAAKKIRSKYDFLTEQYNLKPSIKNSFEERYLAALRARKNLSVFLLAEIEAVDELEEKIKKNRKDVASEKKRRSQKTFADKVLEEYAQKIDKYDQVSICKDADEEIEKLFGGVREFLNDYYPVISIVFISKRETFHGKTIAGFYDKLLHYFGYSGPVPLANHYKDAIEHNTKDDKKILYEHRKIIQETSFLLNDILKFLKELQSDFINTPVLNGILSIGNEYKVGNPKFSKRFNSLKGEEALILVYNFLKTLITDFRLQDMKRS